MDTRPTLQATILLMLVSVATSVAAEQTKPLGMEPLFELNPTDAADRRAQTREFDTGDRRQLMAAGASVLQDMGYRIVESEQSLGLLVGEKVADVPKTSAAHTIAEAGLVTTTLLLSLLVGQDMVTDLPEQVRQKIYISIHLQPVAAGGRQQTAVRLSIDRDMIYDNGSIVPDHTELISIYQEFFGKLLKAEYLEGERL